MSCSVQLSHSTSGSVITWVYDGSAPRTSRSGMSSRRTSGELLMSSGVTGSTKSWPSGSKAIRKWPGCSTVSSKAIVMVWPGRKVQTAVPRTLPVAPHGPDFCELVRWSGARSWTWASAGAAAPTSKAVVNKARRGDRIGRAKCSPRAIGYPSYCDVLQHRRERLGGCAPPTRSHLTSGLGRPPVSSVSQRTSVSFRNDAPVELQAERAVAPGRRRADLGAVDVEAAAAPRRAEIAADQEAGEHAAEPLRQVAV